MAKQINQEMCIQCDLCVTECPNESISVIDDGYVIDASLCTECVGAFDSSRCADVCPVDAVEDGPVAA